jgi:GTP cyclohydrolase II
VSLNRKSLPAEASPNALVDIDRAITDLRRGGLAVIRGGGRGILAVAAEVVSPESLARLSAAGKGRAFVVLTRRRAAALRLAAPTAAPGGAVAISLGRRFGADEIHELADPGSLAAVRGDDLPAESVELLGVETAAVELAKLARLLPAAVVAPLSPSELGTVADRYHALVLEAEDIFSYQAVAARSLTRVSEARVPLADAEETRIIAFRPSDGGIEHLAIVIGNPSGQRPVLARLHSECFTGDLLGSLRCDCGDQLRGAIREIARQGSGVVLYLAQEGRGIGLVNKLRAYRLQDTGFDTVDANERLGFEPDERIYLPAAEMLRGLGFRTVRLMTNNPDKMAQLARCGIQVEGRVPHVFASNGHNEAYLRTKAERSGHLF